MWTYRQANGELFLEDELVSTGYSGSGEGKNNPALQGVADVGPIPRGVYTIGAPTSVDLPGPHGRFVLPLTPRAGDALAGRNGFLIHGDSIEHPGAASHGCIILARVVRNRIAASGDDVLKVIA
jgi:hypothetical protein